MDRDMLKSSFRRESPPKWSCPTCSKGVLQVLQDSFSVYETRSSEAAQSDENWDPEWMEYRYACVLQCSNCREVVLSTGVGGVDWEPEEGEDFFHKQYFDSFTPRFFEPPLVLFEIPEDCPDTVSKPLKESFRLFFCSPNAAANNVRVAIEELLTDLHVNRYTYKKGKRTRLNLHDRIQHLPAKYAPFKDLLVAVKWLGNAGSHGNSEVSVDGVLDAYELTSHILDKVYSSKEANLHKLATKVNKKRGPVR